jgi:retron-type reverse transcriptase
MSPGLSGLREVATVRRNGRYTALLHHVRVALLRDSFHALKRQASPGIGGVTWDEYAIDLEIRLRDLHSSVHRGAYWASPSRRVYIPRPMDGNVRWA